MKNVKIIFALFGVLVIASCQKESQGALNKQSNLDNTQITQMTFIAQTEQTKTAIGGLSAGIYNLTWTAGDQIRVIALDGDGNRIENANEVFTISSGVGENTASFTGTTVAGAAKYYAIYPSSLTANVTNTTIAFTNYQAADHKVSAVEGGFDKSKAAMVAETTNGSFTFKHAVPYFKIQIGEANVKTVKFELFNDGGARIWGNQVVSPSTGSATGFNNGEKANNYVILDAGEGTLTKDGVYYVPFASKASNVQVNLQVTYTDASSHSSMKQTAAFKGQQFTNGNVYDLGCPPISFSPTINVTAPGKLEASATEGSFTFTVSNPDGVSSVSAAIKSGTWISNVAASAGTVTFDCTANTGEERTAVITLSYTGAANVDVTVTQKAPSSSLHTHVFYYNSSGTAVNKTDNADGSYFTATGATNLGGDYHISDWTIGDYSSSKGVKMNSDGSVTFTTSATLNSTVQFWFIRRKTGESSAKIQIVPEGGDATVFDSPWDAYTDSGVLALAKGTSYTIRRSDKEQALLLVIVEETE